MLCEKCKDKPARVHITQMIRGSVGEASSTEVTHHFCEACGREFMQNSPDFKGVSVSRPTSRVEIHAEPNPNPLPLPSEPEIDTSKKWDVYCIDADRQIILYRNALFKGSACLLPHPGGRTHYPGYVELEQANGQSVFLPRSSIFRFCRPGTTLVGETVAPHKPDMR